MTTQYLSHPQADPMRGGIWDLCQDTTGEGLLAKIRLTIRIMRYIQAAAYLKIAKSRNNVLSSVDTVQQKRFFCSIFWQISQRSLNVAP